MRTTDQHKAALRNVFRTTQRNSHTEKFVLWAVLGVWAIGGVGLLFGLVPLEAAAAKELWGFLTAAVTYLFGRIHGQELVATDREE